MNKALATVVIFGVFAVSARAQMAGRRPFVRASGEGVVSVKPDQVRVNASVITQAMTAQEASDLNAGQMSGVLAALRQLLGPNADIRTVGYSVTPNYRYPTGGGTPTLTGYTATNSIEVTLGDLALAGRVIDTAAQAGASSLQGLRFTLKDPEPARLQALRLATMQARTHADAMAGGLGARVGVVLSVEEATVARIQPVYDARVAATPTPVEPGTLEVRASVVLEAELLL